jgi:DNA-binding MarR family transcriptional regulator
VAILVFLYREREPPSFPAIREKFGFTDGNLNRHLKILAGEGWVRTTKTGAGRGSKTTIELTDGGRAGLQELRGWARGVDRLLSSEPVLDQAETPDQDSEFLDDRSRGWEG